MLAGKPVSLDACKEVQMLASLDTCKKALMQACLAACKQVCESRCLPGLGFRVRDRISTLNPKLPQTLKSMLPESQIGVTGETWLHNDQGLHNTPR